MESQNPELTPQQYNIMTSNQDISILKEASKTIAVKDKEVVLNMPRTNVDREESGDKGQRVDLPEARVEKGNEVEKVKGSKFKFQKGNSGYVENRKKPELQLFREALNQVQREKGNISFLLHCVRRAYVSDRMAEVLLRKILPDKLVAEIQEKKFIIICETADKSIQSQANDQPSQ